MQREVDVGNNADLYVANSWREESTDLINEAHMEDVPLRSTMGQDIFYFQTLSLD